MMMIETLITQPTKGTEERTGQAEKIIMKKPDMCISHLQPCMDIHQHHHTTQNIFNQKNMGEDIVLIWTIIQLE
jgi:hypothetical protein